MRSWLTNVDLLLAGASSLPRRYAMPSTSFSRNGTSLSSLTLTPAPPLSTRPHTPSTSSLLSLAHRPIACTPHTFRTSYAAHFAAHSSLCEFFIHRRPHAREQHTLTPDRSRCAILQASRRRVLWSRSRLALLGTAIGAGTRRWRASDIRIRTCRCKIYAGHDSHLSSSSRAAGRLLARSVFAVVHAFFPMACVAMEGRLCGRASLLAVAVSRTDRTV